MAAKWERSTIDTGKANTVMSIIDTTLWLKKLFSTHRPMAPLIHIIRYKPNDPEYSP